MNTSQVSRRVGWSSLWQLVAIWAFLRFLTSFWLAVLSPLRPLTALEESVALWPPGESVALWLERVLLAPWDRWDTAYYVSIVLHGYRAGDGTAQFHPLFPWLARPFLALTGNPLLGLLLVSSLAALGVIIAYSRLAALDLPPAGVRTSLLIFLFFPPAFILFAPYTESLFLLWSILCIYWARRRSWWLAGGAGALATLTRQQGLFLLVPLLWELWEAAERNPQRLLKGWRAGLPLSLIPAGLSGWILFRALALSDVRPDLSSFQGLIYSVVISPDASKVVPRQAFLWPWESLRIALVQIWQSFQHGPMIDLVLAGLFVGFFVAGWRVLRPTYRLYCLVIVLASFSYHTGPFYPYMGLPRHLLLAFPVFIGLGAVVRKSWQRLLIWTLEMLGFLFLAMLYVIEGWAP